MNSANPNIRGSSQVSAHRFRKYLRTPKAVVLIVLVLMTLLASLGRHHLHGLTNALFAVLTAIIVDGAVGLFYRPRRLFSDGGVITALIVADILSTTSPWYASVIVTAIALASKHLLKNKRKPVFNPAAFGLLLSTLLFSTGQSWWGSLALLPWWTIALLIVGGFVVTQKVNKFPQVYAFLATYFILLLVMALLHLGLPSDTPADALRVPFVNSALFLAFFMLTDPPTSPAQYKHQIYFGIFAATISILIFATKGGLAYLYIGLLTANLWKVWISRRAAESRARSASSMRTSQ